jgi:hypothetical protein
LHEEFLYFQGQTTNACAFLLINGSLNEEKELNLTTNHRSPRAKRFTNYALKTEMEEVISLHARREILEAATAAANLAQESKRVLMRTVFLGE